MNTREHDIAALSGAYSLDAVTDAERAEFDALQAESDAVRTEAVELGDTAVQLGLAVAPELPSAALRASILAAVAATPQLPAVDAEPDAAPVIAPEPVVTVSAPVADAEPGPAERRARARWGTPVRALVGAAAAVAIAVGVGAGVTAAIRASDPMTQVQAASDMQSTTSDMIGGGTATVMWSTSEGRAAIDASDLPPLDAGSVYELWFIDEAGATPAGLFTPDGSGDHRGMLEGSYAAGVTIGVTVEPAGGSDAPTTDPILAVTTA